MRLDAVRKLWERLRQSGGQSLEEEDASFTSSELAVGRMVLPLMEDLEEAQRTIDDLGRSAKALAIALDLLPVAAVVLDAKGSFLTSNGAARSLFGGAAVPAAVIEAAEHSLRAGTERTVTSVERSNGTLLRVVPAEISIASDERPPGPGVAFLLPPGSMPVPSDALVSRCGLSPTQAKVAALIAQGLTNKEIAAKLGISSETVHKHLNAVFQRTGVNTRAAVVAVVFGARYGVTSPAG